MNKLLLIVTFTNFIFAGFGNGSDGELYVGGGQELSIGLATAVISNNYSGTSSIEVSDASFLNTDDEVLIITMIDPNENLDENVAGTFETKIIESISGNTLTFTESLETNYIHSKNFISQNNHKNIKYVRGEYVV